MKSLPLLLAAMTVCAGTAYAQTTTPATPATALPYIPLIPGGSNTISTPNAATPSTWFIDVAKSQIVMCAQSNGTGTAPPTFSCTAQAVPAATMAPSSASGGAGRNPL